MKDPQGILPDEVYAVLEGMPNGATRENTTALLFMSLAQELAFLDKGDRIELHRIESLLHAGVTAVLVSSLSDLTKLIQDANGMVLTALTAGVVTGKAVGDGSLKAKEA